MKIIQNERFVFFPQICFSLLINVIQAKLGVWIMPVVNIDLNDRFFSWVQLSIVTKIKTLQRCDTSTSSLSLKFEGCNVTRKTVSFNTCVGKVWYLTLEEVFFLKLIKFYQKKLGSSNNAFLFNRTKNRESSKKLLIP